MDLTLMQLFLIILLAVNIIIPVLYSIVITILFIQEKKDSLRLQKECDKLEEMIQSRLKGPSKEDQAKKIKAGFAMPKDDDGKKEEKVA